MDRGSWLFRCVGGIAVDGGVKGRQLGNVRRDPARLVLGKQFRRLPGFLPIN